MRGVVMGSAVTRLARWHFWLHNPGQPLFMTSLLLLQSGVGLAATRLALAAASRSSQEVAWPNRPVRLIVPGGAGGVTDFRARWLAERLGRRLGQNVYVENMPGAGGNVGTAYAARAAPDGYTLVVVHPGTMTANPHLYAHPGYDPLKDLVPITRVGIGPLVLAVNPALPVTSVEQLIALAKERPGQLTFGSPGIGTPPHLAGELLKRAAGIQITHVPYRGGGQAVADLIGGQINMSIEGTQVQLPFVRSGRLRALAVTGPRRLAMLPDVPTIAEAGVKGYEFMGWVGVAAPSGTPRPIVDRLYREIAAVLDTAEAHEWFARYGLEPGGESPETFAEQIRAEYADRGRLIRAAGIKAE
jgi:tripartite-type tricarboxylate transporter receptor subunit TctC